MVRLVGLVWVDLVGLVGWFGLVWVWLGWVWVGLVGLVGLEDHPRTCVFISGSLAHGDRFRFSEDRAKVGPLPFMEVLMAL